MKKPVRYSRGVAEQIVKRLAAGETLTAICRDPAMPSDPAVRLWAVKDPDGFGAEYARARLLGYERMADELQDIADDAAQDWRLKTEGKGPHGAVLNREHIERSRLRVDTRKWLLSKLLPKVYGDKMQVAGDPAQPIIINMVAADKGF